MVRALPLESACLISLVDLRVSVIFLRSPPAAVPWAVRRKSSSRSLSDSVSASSVDFLATPADWSCSSSAAAERLSSAANWATVVTAIVDILAWYLRCCGTESIRASGDGSGAGSGCKPMFTRLHDQGLGFVFTDTGDF